MGLGVVGTNTFINSLLVFLLISPLFSLVAKPTAHDPYFGYSIKTTLFLLSDLLVKLSVISPIAE